MHRGPPELVAALKRSRVVLSEENCFQGQGASPERTAGRVRGLAGLSERYSFGYSRPAKTVE